jgi:hypothetical protein
MRDIAINTFQGGLNTDVDRRMTPEGDWIASKNIVNYHQGKDGVVKPLLGNAEIPLAPISLPDGINQCIGSYEDEQTKSVIWFNYNSNNQHGIYRYWHEQFKVDQVKIWPNFDFDPSRKITGIAVVDGRYLIWTDVRATPTELSGQPLGTNAGNQPRCLDMEYATLIGGTFLANTGNAYKALSYELFIHFNLITVESIPDPILIQARFTNIDGTVELTPFTTIASIPAQSIPDFENTKDGIYNQLALAIEALIAGSVAEDKRKYTEITIPPGLIGRRMEVQVLNSTEVVAYLKPTNHYYFPHIDEQFDLHKPMPLDHIDAAYIKHVTQFDGPDPIYKDNRYNYGRNTQFTYRYIYYDNSRSPWAPYSIVPTNYQTKDDNPFEIKVRREFSDILLRLQDDKLVEAWTGYIKQVEIAYRTSINNPIVSIGRFYPWDLNETLVYGDTQYANDGWQKVFKGNETAVAVASDEVGSTGDTQVLKLFDWMPKRVNGLTTVADESGQSRIMIGGEAMGYENPIVKANIEVISAFIPLSFGISFEQRSRKFLKKGGRYAVYINYYDKKGFSPGSIRIGYAEIPYDGQAQNVHYLRVTFETPAPSWAVRWRIGISRNLTQGIYQQMIGARASALLVSENGAVVTPTTFDNATHLQIRLGRNKVPDLAEQVTLFDWGENTTGQIYWAAGPKDRVQLVLYGIGFTFAPNPGGYYGEPRNVPFTNSLDSPHFNAPIVGYMSDVGTNFIWRYLLIEKDEIYREWYEFDYAGINLGIAQMLEVYRPSTVSEEFAHETTADGRVYLDGNTYTHLPQGDPQRIDVLGGDTYYQSPKFERSSDTYYSNLYLETKTQYNWNDEELDDFGRVFTPEDGREEYNYQRIRISDAYTPSTRINGLSAFRGLNFIDINKNFGPIMALKNIRDDVAAICWNKIQPIYIGKGRVLQLDGQEQVGRSSSLMTLAAPLMEDLGTQNPESLVSTGRLVYGVDKRMGVVWRYSNDGLTPISYYKNMNKFKDLLVASESSYTVGLFILGGYDPRLKMYFFSLTAHTLYADSREPVQVAGRTFGFCETDNNWKDEFSFIPEMYGVGGIHMVSFKNGSPWKHNQALDENLVAIPPCNFYGVQYVPELTYVVNKNPGTTKVWQNLRMQSKAKWEAIQIIIPPNDKYPLGMLSRLKASNITNREGMFLADFLRDIYDPEFNTVISALLRGRVLRGEILIVSLQGELDNDLVRIDTEYFPSMKTN